MKKWIGGRNTTLGRDGEKILEKLFLDFVDRLSRKIDELLI